jgi:hypothetical protein
MDVADATEMAILDAIRQAPSDRLIEILNFIRGLSSNETADPMVYAGVTPGGMSFEVPPEQIKRFLQLLVETIEVDQVTISFEEAGGSFVEHTYRSETLELHVDDLERHLTDPSFLMEFKGGALYTGGGGCFSLRASLTPDQERRLVGGMLNLSGFDLYRHKEIAGVALFDGGMVVYE